MQLINCNIDPGFYDYNPNQTRTVASDLFDSMATKQDLAVLDQKIRELQKTIDKLTGPCYCESLL